MSIQNISIRACANVQSGYSVKTKVIHDPAGTHQVVIAKHLMENEPYIYRPDHELRISPARPAGSYLLQPGDILFMSRGMKNIATQLLSFPQPAIAPSTFFVLRSKKNIYPPFLAWIINQEPVQAEISELRTGAGTPMIPRKEFTEVVIPVPPLNIQEKIVELDNLMRKEQSLLQRLAEKRKKLVAAACLQVAQGKLRL